MKPKEWLFKNGHITRDDADKRGRLSLANKAIIEDAVSRGELIDGYAVISKPSATSFAKSATPATVKTVEKVKTSDARVLDVPDALREEQDFRAFITVDGKSREIGKRTVCNACHSSLAYCPCSPPRVWANYEVEANVTFRSV